MRKLLPLAALLLLAGAAAPGLLRSMTSSVATAYIYVDGGLPDPGVTPGPSWATKLNNYLLAVDTHDHTPGRGKRVPTAGLNIDADLDLGDFGLKTANWVEFSDDGAPAPMRLYGAGDDLWFESGNGVPIQLTNGQGRVNVRSIEGNYQAGPGLETYTAASDDYTFTADGGATQLSGLRFGRARPGVVTVTSSYTITDSDQVTVLLVDTNLARTITLPPVATAGRLLFVKDKTGSAATNNITVTRAAPTATIDGVTSKTISTTYGVLRLISDGSNWYTL
jgi:hypothetical protein